MILKKGIILTFSDGYYEVQHEKVIKDSGKPYLSEKKTFANTTYLLNYLTPYSVSQELLSDAIKEAKLEAGIKHAKASKLSVEKFKKIRG